MCMHEWLYAKHCCTHLTIPMISAQDLQMAKASTIFSMNAPGKLNACMCMCAVEAYLVARRVSMRQKGRPEPSTNSWLEDHSA